MAEPAPKSVLRCVVVTPERTVVDETADYIAFPAYDGEVGVARNRQPLVARLGPGELRITRANHTTSYYIDGGFGQVLSNVVTVLTARAIPVDSLHQDEIEKQLAQINAEVPNTPEGRRDKATRLRRAQVQLHLVHKRSGRPVAAAH